MTIKVKTEWIKGDCGCVLACDSHRRLIAAAPEMADALRAMMQAADELMTEYVSKKRAANWDVINSAMVDAGKLLARIEGKS